MIGKSYLFRNKAISKQTADYSIHLTKIDWRKLKSTQDEENISGKHGSLISQTFARKRIIEIEGVILAESREKSAKGIDYLDNLFSLKDELASESQDEFNILDDNRKNWVIKVDVMDSVEYEIEELDHIDSSERNFKVSLVAGDPKFYSASENFFHGGEGIFGGTKLGTKLNKKLNNSFNLIKTTTTGNLSTPARIEIQVKNGKTVESPLTIKNLKDGSYFRIKSDGVAGDKFIVDTKNLKLTKNSESIIHLRQEDSVFPIIKQETNFSIYDNDGGLVENDIDIEIYFNDILL